MRGSAAASGPQIASLATELSSPPPIRNAARLSDPRVTHGARETKSKQNNDGPDYCARHKSSAIECANPDGVEEWARRYAVVPIGSHMRLVQAGRNGLHFP